MVMMRGYNRDVEDTVRLIQGSFRFKRGKENAGKWRSRKMENVKVNVV